MKNSSYIAYTLCAFSFLSTIFSVHAWDSSGPKKWYYGLWLTHPIYAVADAKTADWCREGAQVTKIAQEKVLEKYETPRWLSWFNAIPVKESMFDYAYDIYKTIQLEMDGLMELIDKEIDKRQLSEASRNALEEQQAAWRSVYHEKLNHVLAEGAVKFEPTDDNILKNIKAVLEILDALILVLNSLTIASPMPVASIRTPKPTIKTRDIPAHQVVAAQKEKSAEEVMKFQENQQSLDVKKERLKASAQAVRMRLGQLIGKDFCGKDILTKKRVGWFERKHRELQAKWLADYVNNICRACAIR